MHRDHPVNRNLILVDYWTLRIPIDQVFRRNEEGLEQKVLVGYGHCLSGTLVPTINALPQDRRDYLRSVRRDKLVSHLDDCTGLHSPVLGRPSVRVLVLLDYWHTQHLVLGKQAMQAVVDIVDASEHKALHLVLLALGDCPSISHNRRH